jgi:hypothetical protein
MKSLNMSYIHNSTVIGRSGNTDDALDNTFWFYGLVGPRSNDWFAIYNISFYNFDFPGPSHNGSAALGDCS